MTSLYDENVPLVAAMTGDSQQAEHPPSNRRRALGWSALAIALSALVWPYVRYPTQIFYNRYFEATMTFNPAFAYATYASGWTQNFHLGYPTLTEPSYLSIFTILIAIFHLIGGTTFASHAYPLVVALFAFGSMLAYLSLREYEISLGFRSLLSFFFAVNPVTAGMIHEGYSGMMIDYALIPLMLCFVDWAVDSKRPLLLCLVPVVFTATSMFKLPEVAIAMATIVALRFDVWRRTIREHPRVVALLGLAFVVNAYWALPMLLNLMTHAFLPIQDDTAGEIALSTRYSTLSNVVLGRVFGIFEHDTSLCRACDYYTSAAFTLGMLLVVGLAVWGIVRCRAWLVLALVLVSTAMATGYHYQDDLLGLPYELLMQMPTFGIFRSSGVFSIVTFFCYTLGLAFAVREARRLAPIEGVAVRGLVLVGIALASWPTISGATFERGTIVAGVVSAPNFYVTVPRSYEAARDALRSEGSNGTTLIVPNESFAAYRWGAYVQDFLPAMLGRPTLQRWYWRENNSDVDRLLATLTSTAVSSDRLTALMRATRIDSVLFHNDTVDRPLVSPNRYGRPIFKDGDVAVYRPPLEPVALLTEDGVPIVAIGGAAADAPVLETLTSRSVADGPSAIGCEGREAGYAFIRGATIARSPVLVPEPARCSGQILVRAFVAGKTPKAIWHVGVFRSGRLHRLLLPHATMTGDMTRLDATLRIQKGEEFGLVPSYGGAEVLALLSLDGRRTPTPEQSLPWHPFAGALATVRIDASASTLVLHEANDPSWVALNLRGLRSAILPKFNADGFANGWRVEPGTILLVNVAQLSFLVGIALALTATIALVRLTVLPYRPCSELRLRFGRRRPTSPRSDRIAHEPKRSNEYPQERSERR